MRSDVFLSLKETTKAAIPDGRERRGDGGVRSGPCRDERTALLTSERREPANGTGEGDVHAVEVALPPVEKSHIGRADGSERVRPPRTTSKGVIYLTRYLGRRYAVSSKKTGRIAANILFGRRA